MFTAEIEIINYIVLVLEPSKKLNIYKILMSQESGEILLSLFLLKRKPVREKIVQLEQSYPREVKKK